MLKKVRYLDHKCNLSISNQLKYLIISNISNFWLKRKQVGSIQYIFCVDLLLSLFAIFKRRITLTLEKYVRTLHDTYWLNWHASELRAALDKSAERRIALFSWKTLSRGKLTNWVIHSIKIYLCRGWYPYLLCMWCANLINWTALRLEINRIKFQSCQFSEESRLVLVNRLTVLLPFNVCNVLWVEGSCGLFFLASTGRRRRSLIPKNQGICDACNSQ